MKLALYLIVTAVMVSGPAAAQAVGPRLSELEEFRLQQRDYNAEFDMRINRRLDDVQAEITKHIDEMRQEQGSQNDKIASMDSRLNLVYGIGDAGVWALGIIVTLYLFFNDRKYKENRESQRQQHLENQEALKNVGAEVKELAGRVEAIEIKMQTKRHRDSLHP